MFKMCAFVFMIIGIIDDVTVAILVAENGSTVTATVLVRFTQNLACVYLHSLLGLGLQFSVLRHQLPVKIAVEKTVKTGSDLNSKTKCRL